MLFDEKFEGLDERAYQAFEKRKWASNLFNMERLSVREQLKALGSLVHKGLQGDYRFHWDVTPHTPSVFNAKSVSELVLFFTRNLEEQRAIVPLLDSRISLPDQISDAGEHHRHATLGVRIDDHGCEVGLMLHSTAWLDVMNLLNRCRVPFERATFVERVRALPSGVFFRFSSREEIPASDFSGDHVDRLEEEVLNEEFLIFLGVRYDTDGSEPRSHGFSGTCLEVLGALLPIWEYVAWKPASDFLEVAQESKRLRTAGESGTADLAVGQKVRVSGGVFAGRDGVITDMDHKGFVRVLVGKVSIRTDGRSLQVVR